MLVLRAARADWPCMAAAPRSEGQLNRAAPASKLSKLPRMKLCINLIHVQIRNRKALAYQLNISVIRSLIYMYQAGADISLIY